MELYKTTGGSKFFGIDVPDSDFDTLICDSNVLVKHSIYDEQTKNHTYRLSIAETIAQLNGFMPVPQWVSFLKPDNDLSNSLLEQYLNENNELIIAANRKSLFGVLLRYLGDEIPSNSSFVHFPKKNAYRLMFLEGFAKYANGEKFFNSITQSGTEQEFFRNIRLGKISYSEYVEHWHNARTQLNKNAHFFNHFDLEFLRKNTAILEEILGYDHESFVQNAMLLLSKTPEISILF